MRLLTAMAFHEQKICSKGERAEIIILEFNKIWSPAYLRHCLTVGLSIEATAGLQHGSTHRCPNMYCKSCPLWCNPWPELLWSYRLGGKQQASLTQSHLAQDIAPTGYTIDFIVSGGSKTNVQRLFEWSPRWSIS